MNNSEVLQDFNCLLSQSDRYSKSHRDYFQVLSVMPQGYFLCMDRVNNQLRKMRGSEIHKNFYVKNMLYAISKDENPVLAVHLGVLPYAFKGEQVLLSNRVSKTSLVYNYAVNNVRLYKGVPEDEAEHLIALHGTTRDDASTYCKLNMGIVHPKEISDIYDKAQCFYFAESYTQYQALKHFCNDFCRYCLVAVNVSAIPNITGNIVEQLPTDCNVDALLELTMEHLNTVSTGRFKLVDAVRYKGKDGNVQLTDYAFILAIREKYCMDCKTREELINKMDNMFVEWERNEKILSYVDEAMTIINSSHEVILC